MMANGNPACRNGFNHPFTASLTGFVLSVSVVSGRKLPKPMIWASRNLGQLSVQTRPPTCPPAYKRVGTCRKPIKAADNQKKQNMNADTILKSGSIDLGLGLTAKWKITYEGPWRSIPPHGSDWDVERDHVWARLELSLPSPCTWEDTALTVLGDTLYASWGWSDGDYRCKTFSMHGLSLRELVRQLTERVIDDCSKIQRNLAARDARIKLRDARIAAALDYQPE